MDFLEVSRSLKSGKASVGDLQSTADALQQTLQDFNINAEVVGWIAGPTVTLFKVIVAPKDVVMGQSAASSPKISDDMMRILVTANASLAVLLAVVLVLVIMRLIIGKRQKEAPKTATK